KPMAYLSIRYSRSRLRRLEALLQQRNCSSGCSGVVAWAFANPLTSPSLSRVVVPTSTYTLSPQADQPGCTACLETFDTCILATPVYNNGKISLAIETGVNNGTHIVPGILWGQVLPTLS